MIQMVRQCPLLWDTTIEQYRRTDLKRTHWDRIAQALGSKFTGDMVCKRFQNMESTFRTNERKIRESKTRCSGKGTDEIYKPKWEYYDMLLFLRRTCAQSDSIDNLSLKNHISNQDTINHSPVHGCNNVQNTSRITNIYYDENIQQYVIIPPDLSDNNTASTNTDQMSSSVESESYISSELIPDPASVVTTSVSQSPTISDSQNELTINNTSDISTRITSPRPILNTTALSNKRSTENSLYVKRGC